MDQIHRQFQTNVFGLIAPNKAFIPHFREQGSGVIINIGSISAEQGYPYTSVYEASKAAVVSLSEGLNAELAEFGVAVKAVLPGNMDTGIFHKIDQAKDVPDAYDASVNAFHSRNSVRSDPPRHGRGHLRGRHRQQARQGPLLLGPRWHRDPQGQAVARPGVVLAGVPGRRLRPPSPLWQALVPVPVAADE